MTDKIIHEVKIESICFGGKGVSKIDGQVCFVPFTLPGEQVKIEVLKNKKTYLEAKPIEILVPSPIRVQAPCPYFGSCGGCAYQMLPYEEQLLLKKKQMEELHRQFSNKSFTCPPIQETLPSPQPLHYRSKIRMKFKSGKNTPRLGFFDHYNNHLTHIEQCPIASKGINEFLKNLHEDDYQLFKNHRKRSYNLVMLESGKGIIDNLRKEKQCHHTFLGKEFFFDINSFFQINHSIFPSLIEEVKLILKNHLSNCGTLLDLYCGVGFFGILLSDLFERITFIEQNKTSFSFLEKNISENHLFNKSEFLLGDAKDMVSKASKHFDCVIIDPPRSGCDPQVVHDLTQIDTEAILYISCNPSTQFRDLNLFYEKGFETVYIKPMDFFPQTMHIESLALLKRITNHSS